MFYRRGCCVFIIHIFYLLTLKFIGTLREVNAVYHNLEFKQTYSVQIMNEVDVLLLSNCLHTRCDGGQNKFTWPEFQTGGRCMIVTRRCRLLAVSTWPSQDTHTQCTQQHLGDNDAIIDSIIQRPSELDAEHLNRVFDVYYMAAAVSRRRAACSLVWRYGNMIRLGWDVASLPSIELRAAGCE